MQSVSNILICNRFRIFEYAILLLLSFPVGMAEELPTPELLDPVVDSGHRSYMSAVEHKHLATFQCRPPKEYLELDNRWLQR